MIEKKNVSCKTCNGLGIVTVVSPASLRSSRERAGISLREMARRLNFSPPYISDVEQGRRRCTDQIEQAYSSLKPKKGK